MPSQVSLLGLLAVVGGLVIIAAVIGVGILPSGSLAPYLATQVTAPQESDTPNPTPEPEPEDDDLFEGVPPCSFSGGPKPGAPGPDRPRPIACALEATCVVEEIDENGNPILNRYTHRDEQRCVADNAPGICIAGDSNRTVEYQKCTTDVDDCRLEKLERRIEDSDCSGRGPNCAPAREVIESASGCGVCWRWVMSNPREGWYQEKACAPKGPVSQIELTGACVEGPKDPTAAQDGLSIDFTCQYNKIWNQCQHSCRVTKYDSRDNCKEESTVEGDCRLPHELQLQQPSPNIPIAQNSPTPAPESVVAFNPSQPSLSSIAKVANPNTGTCADNQDGESVTFPLNCNLPMVGALSTVSKCLADEEAKCKQRKGTFKSSEQPGTGLTSLISELRAFPLCTVQATSQWECVGGQ